MMPQEMNAVGFTRRLASVAPTGTYPRGESTR